MSAPDDSDDILDLVLAGTPGRILDVVLGPVPGARAESDALHGVLADLALSLAPVPPPPGLRNKLAVRLGAVSVNQPRRALLVLDMIEDYLTPGLPLHVPRARQIIPAVRARLDQAHQKQEPVVYLCDQHDPDDPELQKWPVHAVAGTRGCSVVPELAPLASDVIIPHRTYSAFVESDLEAVLRKLDVNTLVLTGCATELGLFATATDALMRGYNVEVPPDCQAGGSEIAEQVVLGVLHVMRPFEPATHAGR